MIKSRHTTVSGKSYNKAVGSGDNSKHAAVSSWLIGLAVISVAVVALPVFLWAQKTGIASAQMPLRVSVDAGSLMDLQAKIGALQQALDQVLGSRADMGVVQGLISVGHTDDLRADCLNKCRDDLALCKETSMTILESDQKPSNLHPCLLQANSCINKCSSIPPPPISCQDRCAVALGGCIKEVIAPMAVISSDPGAALNLCRQNNIECLMNACKLSDQANMPPDYCHDQCKRMSQICNSGSVQYDMAARQLCDRLEQNCMDKVCYTVAQVDSTGGTIGEAPPVEKPATIDECKAICQDKFLNCSYTAVYQCQTDKEQCNLDCDKIFAQ